MQSRRGKYDYKVRPSFYNLSTSQKLDRAINGISDLSLFLIVANIAFGGLILLPVVLPIVLFAIAKEFLG